MALALACPAVAIAICAVSGEMKDLGRVLLGVVKDCLDSGLFAPVAVRKLLLVAKI